MHFLHLYTFDGTAELTELIWVIDHQTWPFDRRIDSIIKDWHQNSDLLFAVHPVDGSLLVWVADFLDEYQPGAFRQAQVSFSSRIPNAIPLGDAMTIGSNVDIYNTGNLSFKDMMQAGQEEAQQTQNTTQKGMHFEIERLSFFSKILFPSFYLSPY